VRNINNLLAIASRSEFQQQEVTGKVTDIQTGETMPGVNVVVKGTNVGAITDGSGRYSINVADKNAVLVFSFIGYGIKEVPFAGKSIIDVVLERQVTGLEEVVVVGYGTQKKANLTGSLSSVNIESFQAKAVGQNLSAAFIGEASGVTVRQSTSSPGNDDAEIRIRGNGTFSSAGSSPLVLVDGIQQDMNNVNMNDIQSISILKDASSAAIYGTRAANGVILIETKRGKSGKMEVSLNSYVGFQRITEKPDFVDSWEYAESTNEALHNMGLGPQYTDEDIQLFKSGTSPDTHPNSNSFETFYSSGNPIQYKTDLAFSGGNENTTFRFSLGYNKNNSLVARAYAEDINFRLNVDSKLLENLYLKLNISGNRGFHTNPTSVKNGQWGFDPLIKTAYWYPVTLAEKNSDGTYNHYQGANVQADLDGKGYMSYWLDNIFVDPAIVWNILPELKITGEVSLTTNYNKNKFFKPKFTFSPSFSTSYAELQQQYSDNNLLTLRTIAEYSKTFNKVHEFRVLAGFEEEDFSTGNIHAYRNIFPNNSLFELNAASTENMTNSGNASEWAMQSYFGRINYVFNRKYLVEINSRYDGSSRFPKNNRWGFFPSGSLGWRISEEEFMNSLTSIDNLKLRASYGILGNSQISNYPYQRTINLGQDYPIGDVLAPGAATTVLPNELITWEKTSVLDIGLDFTLFDSKIDGSIDYFDKVTSDILYSISSSDILGLTPSEQNAGEVNNKGWDFNLSYQDKKGDFSYRISSNFSVIKNKVVSLAQVEKDIAKGLFVGESLGALYGYVWDGWFVDDADIQSYAPQPFVAQPGLPRFKDISGPDGIPDGVVDATYDQKVIGSTFPKYTFATTISASYKKFYISMLWQGSAGVHRYLRGMIGSAFHNWGPVQRWQYEGRWTEDNPDRYAVYPRFENSLKSIPVGMLSTFWARDASFLKLKNLEIGYNLPSTIANKLGLGNVRIYASGTNLLNFDKFPKGWDAEEEYGDWYWGVHYPLLSTTVFGVNIDF